MCNKAAHEVPRTGDIRKSHEYAQGQRGGNKAGAGGGAVAEQLHTQVRGARRLLTDLEVLSRIAIDTLAGVLRSSR